MKVSSPAGDLDVAINGYSIEKDKVVFDAAVGVWEVKVNLGLKDFRFFLSVLFNPKVMLFIVRNFFFNPTK
jgi:hypothetical protein